MPAYTIDHVLERDTVAYSFGPDMTPAIEVDPGAVLRLELQDCFSGQITSEDQLVRDVATDLDLARVNPATGPISVRGAEPGDSIVVEILDIRPGSVGTSLTIPGIGQLAHLLPDPVTRRIPVVDGVCHLSDRISFPVRPMVGVIGVATAAGDPIPNGFAGEHGGNLDDHLNGIGSKLYMPVRQPGGMLGIGDMHASMGDGEICVTGVEIDGEIDIRVSLLKDRQGRWPVTELADSFVAHGTAGPDMREAFAVACEEAARILVDQWSFTIEEAFVFLSVACDAGICQACQPSPFTTIARVRIPKIGACPAPFRV